MSNTRVFVFVTAHLYLYLYLYLCLYLLEFNGILSEPRNMYLSVLRVFVFVRISVFNNLDYKCVCVCADDGLILCVEAASAIERGRAPRCVCVCVYVRYICWKVCVVDAKNKWNLWEEKLNIAHTQSETDALDVRANTRKT